MRYMAVIEMARSGYGALVPDLPGCIAAGGTAVEVLALIKEAIQFHLEGIRAGGLQIPLPASRSALVEVTSVA